MTDSHPESAPLSTPELRYLSSMHAEGYPEVVLREELAAVAYDALKVTGNEYRVANARTTADSAISAFTIALEEEILFAENATDHAAKIVDGLVQEFVDAAREARAPADLITDSHPLDIENEDVSRILFELSLTRNVLSGLGYSTDETHIASLAREMYERDTAADIA